MVVAAVHALTPDGYAALRAEAVRMAESAQVVLRARPA
jgi:hypothetical protein